MRNRMMLPRMKPLRMKLLASVAVLAMSPVAMSATVLAQESTSEPLLPPAQQEAPAELQPNSPATQAPADAAPADPAVGDDAIGDVVVEPAVTPPPAEAVLLAQRPDEMRSEDLIGATVINSEGEEIGKVKDILFDTSGAATGVVLSVGGILGVGAKDVGLAWQEVDLRPEPDDLVRVNYTKAQLEAAPAFKTQEALDAETMMNEPIPGTVEPAPAPQPTQ